MQYGWDLNEHMGRIGLSITNWNTFKQSVFQIYQTIVLLVICHIWNSHGAISGFKSIVVICIITCIRERAYATSSYSYNIGWSCIIAHNTTPHVYTTRGGTSIYSFKVLFHISITKSQLHKQCLVNSIRYIHKGHISSTSLLFSTH